MPKFVEHGGISGVTGYKIRSIATVSGKAVDAYSNAFTQVIEDDWRVPRLRKRNAGLGADKAGSAGDEDGFHGQVFKSQSLWDGVLWE